MTSSNYATVTHISTHEIYSLVIIDQIMTSIRLLFLFLFALTRRLVVGLDNKNIEVRLTSVLKQVSELTLYSLDPSAGRST